MLSQETDHVSPTEVTPELGKEALGTWRPTRPYGGRLDKTGTYAGYGLGGEAVGKPGVAGVYTNQRLSLSMPWKGLRMICQGFKPDPGNPAVRHYRGASRNVRYGETVNPSCNRKSGNGNPSPTVGRARSLSQPAASFEARYAPSSHPTEADLAPMLPEARCGLENKFVEHVVLAVRRSTGCRRGHFGCGWSSQCD